MTLAVEINLYLGLLGDLAQSIPKVGTPIHPTSFITPLDHLVCGGRDGPEMS